MAGTPMSAAIWDEASGPTFQSPPVALPGRPRRVRALERPSRPCRTGAWAGNCGLREPHLPGKPLTNRTLKTSKGHFHTAGVPRRFHPRPPPCASTRRPRPASRPSITAPLTRAALRLRTPGTLQPYCHLVPHSIGRRQEGPATRNHVRPGQTDAARNAKRAPGQSPRGPLTCCQLYRGV